MPIEDAALLESETHIVFSQVVGALSYALDIAEGQPTGHAARSCIIGMRLAREIGLQEEESVALFYALLLKDLGCSSNASKVACLFGGDDRAIKCELKTTNFTKMNETIRYIARNVAPDGTLLQKAARFAAVAASRNTLAKDLIQMRCDRGATIARSLLLPELTAQAIHSLDEHWDGKGYPDGLAGDEIPILSRIMGLAQTVEVFWRKDGMVAACDVAVDRSEIWFDPALVRALLRLREDESLLAGLTAADPAAFAAGMEPGDWVIEADEAALDRLAEGFSQVVDAKSPWTYQHSRGVAEIAVGLAEMLGISGQRLRTLRRAALLHDIGKLGVSNQILDKPGKLTPEELVLMRKHPRFTFEILHRVQGFNQFAELAGGHHERLDGKGYHRGLAAESITQDMRILVVADMYEALAAKRPYRKDLSTGEAMAIIQRDTGTGLCPQVVEALNSFIGRGHFVPYTIAA